MSILNTNQAEFPTAFQLLTYRLTPLFSDRLIIYHFWLLNAFCFKTKKDKTKKAKLLCIFAFGRNKTQAVLQLSLEAAPLLSPQLTSPLLSKGKG